MPNFGRESVNFRHSSFIGTGIGFPNEALNR
jgi:hypothetical protein